MFAGSGLVLAVATVLLAVRAGELRDPLRGALALVTLGFAAVLAYETFAYLTGIEPTISFLAALEFAVHPALWLGLFLPFMLLAGALAHHFTFGGHRPHWGVIAAGAAAYLLGAVLVELTGWAP